MHMIREVLAKVRNQEGATAVEYAIMVALIAAVIIVAVTALGNNVDQSLCTTAGDLGTATC